MKVKQDEDEKLDVDKYKVRNNKVDEQGDKGDNEDVDDHDDDDD